MAAWTCALELDRRRLIVSGSDVALAVAIARGTDVKVRITGLCNQWSSSPAHAVFAQAHVSYYYTDEQLFIAGVQPLVWVVPGIPLRYASEGGDFGWALARTDRLVAGLWCDPYPLRFCRTTDRRAIRWFVR